MGLIIVVVIVLGILAFIPEIQKHRAEQAEVRRLENEISNQKAIQRRQTQEMELLRSDPEYVELMARDKMDLMKEGETIFRLDTTGTVTSTPPVLPTLPATPPEE